MTKQTKGVCKYNNMVSGHLQIKKGYYYVVLSYYDNRNKRHVKYVSTGLPEKGNKRKAEAALARVRSEFEPPQESGRACFQYAVCGVSFGVAGHRQGACESDHLQLL